MHTRVLDTRTPAALAAAAAEGAALLRAGEVVGMPTETVYGLAADAFNPAAVEKIFLAKGRPQDNPLIVHIADRAQLTAVVREVSATARRLMEAFWPGPLTLLFPKSEALPACVTAGLPTVAVRMPSHPAAQALITAAGTPLAAPSANRSGRPSTTTAAHVLHDMDGRIPLILDGGPCEVGLESTVLSLQGEKATILRPGAVTAEMLRGAGVEVQIAGAVLQPLAEGEAALSPGMKHKHYAPDARVVLLSGSPEAAAAYAAAHFPHEGSVYLAFDDEPAPAGMARYSLGASAQGKEKAHEIFTLLRQADEDGFRLVLVRTETNEGIGLAVNNRLLRAANFEVISV